jgi:hypothetical protein
MFNPAISGETAKSVFDVFCRDLDSKGRANYVMGFIFRRRGEN